MVTLRELLIDAIGGPAPDDRDHVEILTDHVIERIATAGLVCVPRKTVEGGLLISADAAKGVIEMMARLGSSSQMLQVETDEVGNAQGAVIDALRKALSDPRYPASMFEVREALEALDDLEKG